MRQTLLCCGIGLGAAACTKGGGFLSFLSASPSQERSAALTGGAGSGTLPKLSREDLRAQLKGIAVTPGGDGKDGSGGDFLLCASEQTKSDRVWVNGESVDVLYEANADACPASLLTK